ncbi:DUF1796 family putative cysteine peptidase [Paenibacillus sp. J22TS3]|uniref:DUF1796 family putative cysteine peptidase n=1 Tax=Paenibacillus sp. J22TS3 TaxID=2807192 RepID=UPI001B111FEA|nr:DUF1796 family putative cysteine peptidase [Paenibacillus sp. J22TS3]GIP23951.1 hypothetical protein J22TS3_42260 [Paenibacillus sp. J22TS3]
MLDSEFYGVYDAVFSLGSNCQTAYQLRRLGLRQEAGPLDWFISNSHKGLVSVLENRFEDFMELDHMTLVGQFQTCYCIKDEKYQIFSYHDFPVKLPRDRWSEAYPEFHERQLRRQTRFLEAARSLERLLFVRLNCTPDEALQLHDLLTGLVTHQFTLLVVNTRQELGCESAPTIRGGIVTAELYKGEDWRGDDVSWGGLMQHIRLRKKSI